MKNKSNIFTPFQKFNELNDSSFQNNFFNYKDKRFSRHTLLQLKKIQEIYNKNFQKLCESNESKYIDSLIIRIRTTKNIKGTLLKNNVIDYLNIVFNDYHKQKRENIFYQNLAQELQVKFDLLLESFDDLTRKYIQKELSYKKLKKSYNFKKKRKIDNFYKNKSKLYRVSLMQEKLKNNIACETANPILKELMIQQMKEKKQRRYSNELFKVSFLFSLNTIIYEKTIRHFLPLPSKRQINNHFKEIIKQNEKNLFDVKKIISTIQFLRKNNVIPKEKFEINLGVDAMAFELYSSILKSKKIKQYLDDNEIAAYSRVLSHSIPLLAEMSEQDEWKIKSKSIPDYINYVFAFVAMPLNPLIRIFPLLFVPSETGKATRCILEIMMEIVKICKEQNIIVKYISSDGDNAYDIEHVTVFRRYNELLFNNVDEIFNIISEYNIWILSDFPHLLKIARNRMKNSIFLFDENNFFSSKQINNVLQLGTPLEDFSPISKLKDSYPKAIFTLNNFLKLYENRKTWNSAIYILPYAIIEIFLFNSRICTELRLHLIQVTYKIFEFFYVYRIKTEKIGDKMLKGKDGVNFASEINIIRTMNSLIGLYNEIKRKIPLGLSRLGTQPIENFFGQVRSNTQKENNWCYLKKSIIITTLSKTIKENFGIKTKIRGRVSSGGARLNIYEENQPEIEMKEKINIEELMNCLKERFQQIQDLNDQEYEESLKYDNLYRYFIKLNIEISKHKDSEPINYLQSKNVAKKIIGRFME